MQLFYDAKTANADNRIDLQNLRNEKKILETKLADESKEVQRLKNDVAAKDKSILSLRKEKEADKEKIESLQNQVKLLKSQFGKQE